VDHDQLTRADGTNQSLDGPVEIEQERWIVELVQAWPQIPLGRFDISVATPTEEAADRYRQTELRR
jgi:hypothetical protein